MAQDDKSASRRESYQNTFAEHGDTPQAMQYDTYKAQAKRFVQLIADIEITGKTILDAGCGMGDLVPFLYTKSLSFDYLGMDITPEFIDVAKKRYLSKDVTFDVGNPFDNDLDKKYDIVISSGVMNIKTPGWMDQRKKMIEQLWSYTGEVLVFNMAGWMGESVEGDKRIAYANIPEILAFCASLTPKLILRNQYHAKDFTVVMFR